MASLLDYGMKGSDKLAWSQIKHWKVHRLAIWNHMIVVFWTGKR